VIDTEGDLNAYAKVENQGGCCSPAASSLKVVETGCCSMPKPEDTLHARLLNLLTRYNVNDYAASVRVFAVKPCAERSPRAVDGLKWSAGNESDGNPQWNLDDS